MHLGAKVVRYRKVIFLVSILLLIPSILGFVGTRINYDMLTYLPSDMETMQGQELLMEDFGKGGFSLVVVENMKTHEVSQLAEDISRVDHVDSVINLEKLIDPTVPIDMYPSIIRENFSNPDATMLVVFFDTSTSDDATLEAVEQIRKIGNEDTYIAGMTSLVLDLKNITEAEEFKYVACAVIVSLLVMMLLLDSYIAPVLFLASIGMAILYNMGTNIFFGEISFITMAIAAVLQLGVTMDYSIFLWHSYMEKLDSGLEEKRAMAEAVDATLAAVTGSSVTTVAGFLALCFMTYTMGRDLGLVMAKGVIFGVICSVTVLPVMLLRFSGLLRRTRHKSLIPDARRLAHYLTGRYWIYLLIFAVALVPAVYGYSHRNVTYDFTRMMSGSADEVDADQAMFMAANDKLQEDFGIATSYIIIADADLPAKDGRALCSEMEDVPGVKSVLGLDALLPAAIPRSALPDEITDALIAGDHQMILVNSEYRVSTEDCNTQLDVLNSIVKKYDPTATVIGEGPATKDLIRLTARDFTVVNWISIAAVFVIILLVLRSASLPFLLVAAIEFAIFVNMGIPGFTGLELPFIVPVCISTIQLGSTVDYAILQSTRYKAERMAGKERREAIEIASYTSIPSILVSALGFFAATFGVAVYSNISIISTLCSLMARGAIISMLTVIFILPSMLMAFDKIICKTTIGLRGIRNAEVQ
ncbi:MAG: MMPL family transporter [Mogibacterium sp.]|nr:MMPL family transporter [Mogibacterium sp.]